MENNINDKFVTEQSFSPPDPRYDVNAQNTQDAQPPFNMNSPHMPQAYQGNTYSPTVIPVNSDVVSNVTSINDLRGYGEGAIVRFPDFAEGQPFVAKVRRPSMMVLAKQGKIPNSLLNAASDLFTGGPTAVGKNNNSGNLLSDVYDICEILCRACLISPTYDEIIQAGITLSDDQIMAIFNYAQVGAKSLENFRKE